jgi:thioredoxin-dependent peroxiredoxin
MSENILLEINTLAPSFSVTDIFGRKINLRDYRGKKVLVAFFRHAGCPFCNMRVHMLQQREKEFKDKNLEMIFFFESEEKVLKSHIFHSKVNPIPLIGDPLQVWYTAYGVESSSFKSAISHITSIVPAAIKAKMKGLPVHMMEGNESIKTIPAEFLIDEKGIIKKVYYSKRLNDRMAIGVIQEFAKNK